MSQEKNNEVKKISSGFLKFLKDNYKAKEKHDLYTLFLKDFYNSINSQKELNLFYNVNEINKINKDLFIRDEKHYYYFYPEVLVFNENNLQNIESKIGELPNHFILIELRNVSEKYSGSYYKSLNVMFNQNGVFFEKMKERNDNSFIEYLIEEIKFNGEISLFKTSSFFINGNNLQLLDDKYIQEIISVLFWKYLCINVNIDFHKPGDKQPWQNDIENFIIR